VARGAVVAGRGRFAGAPGAGERPAATPHPAPPTATRRVVAGARAGARQPHRCGCCCGRYLGCRTPKRRSWVSVIAAAPVES